MSFSHRPTSCLLVSYIYKSLNARLGLFLIAGKTNLLFEVKGNTTLSSPISVHIKYFFIYTYTPFVSSHTQGLNNAPLEITLLHMALQCHVPSRLEAVPPSHYIRIPYCHPIMTWPRATTSPHIPGSVPPTRHVQALFYTLPTRSVLIILILAKLSKQKRQHRRIYFQ